MNTPAANRSGVELANVEFAWPRQAAFLSVSKFSIAEGEKLFLQGASGSGKSTLLNILCGVLKPQSGDVFLFGEAVHHATAGQRDRIRADLIGVIFQMFNLVPYLSLVENVLLPCRFSKRRAQAAGENEEARNEAAMALLSRLGLADEAEDGRVAAKLSVGQQQRVAAARALIGRPPLIVADEPTSALDANARDRFLETLLDEAEKAGSALLFVSHDASLGRRFDRVLTMASLNAAFAENGKAH